MSNDYLAVWLYRWDDANEQRDASHVGFGERKEATQMHPSVVIGVATRPVREPIEHHSTSPEYEGRVFEQFQDHVEEHADDVRWLDDPLDCRGESDD